jgi:tetratricopeptide (TPR) repeat protein
MSSLVSSFIILIAVLVVITWLSVAGLRRLRTYSKRRAGERRQEQAEQVKKSLADMRDSLSPEQKRVDQGNNDFEPTGHEAGQRAKESTGKPASQAQRTVGQDADQRRATEAEPWATFLRGSIFEERGEYDLAVEAYQQAMDSKHAEWAPKAVFNLGMLFEERGEYDRAEEAYQRAIDSEHSDAASKARLNLGVLFEKWGEYDRAEVAYQQAIDSGHPEVAPTGMRNLRGLPMRSSARAPTQPPGRSANFSGTGHPAP